MSRFVKVWRSMFPTTAQRVEQEALILKALADHPGGLTGYEISRYVDSLAAVPTSFGGLYAMLARMQRDGKVRRTVVATWRDAAGVEQQRSRYVLPPHPGAAGGRP
jgi:hypothetical protein